jgi:hypothetical protein
MFIILADTNKLFGMLRAIILEKSQLRESIFANYIREHTVYISTFIIDELYRIAVRYNLPITTSDIETLIHIT